MSILVERLTSVYGNLRAWSESRYLTTIGNFVLVFIAASCTLSTIIYAFQFSVDPVILFLVWMITSLAASLLAYFRQVKGLLLLFIPILALLIIWFDDIFEAAGWVIFYISNNFSTWLFVPVLFTGAYATTAQQTLFFTFAGMLLIVPVSIAICLRRSLLITALLTAPIVFLVFVHVFTPPHPIFTLGLLAVYVTLLFSPSLENNGKSPVLFPKQKNRPHAFRFSLAAFILAVVLLGAAFIITPQHNFTRNSVVISLDHYVRNFAERIGLIRTKTGVGWPHGGDGVWSFDTNNIIISEAGAIVLTGVELLEVTTTEAGVFYLKGYSMQRFEEGSWVVSSEHAPLVRLPWIDRNPATIIEAYHRINPDSAIRNIDMVITRTGEGTENIVYTPYHNYAVGQTEDVYLFSFFHPLRSIIELHEQLPPDTMRNFDLAAYSERVHSRNTYLQINDSTAYGLRQIAADVGIDSTADRAVIVSKVAQYFTTFGQYTLSPLLIPEGEDFALYFLQISQHGYCIHYATAATLMLRALGIPARFTVGFVAAVPHSEVIEPVVLTDANAHAWVEVFYDDIGWLPIEVTPPIGFGYGGFFGRSHAEAMPLHMMFTADYWYGYDFVDPWADEALDWGVGTGSVQPVEQNDPWREYGWAPVGLLFAAGLLTLIVRRIVVLYLRKSRFSQSDTNAAAIYAWGYISRVAGRHRQSLLSKRIKGLAYKAYFSQHRLTEGERDSVVDYAMEFSNEMHKKRGILTRLISKYILGL